MSSFIALSLILSTIIILAVLILSFKIFRYHIYSKVIKMQFLADSNKLPVLPCESLRFILDCHSFIHFSGIHDESVTNLFLQKYSEAFSILSQRSDFDSKNFRPGIGSSDSVISEEIRQDLKYSGFKFF